MAKRFIDTKMWDKAWFRKLTPQTKLIWIYLLTKCDHAGIWDADWEAAEFFIGERVSYRRLPKVITDKMEEIENGKQYFIPSFIEFQYGELREKVAPHKSVIKRLSDKKLLNTIKSVPITLKDKDIKEDIDKRKKKFINKCMDINKNINLDNKIINEIITYWTKKNQSGRKMKFEMQQTFDISRRMKKWFSNHKEWNLDKSQKTTFVSKFKKTNTGLYKAWCSKCGKREFPNNEYQLKQGSSCCAVDYLPKIVNA